MLSLKQTISLSELNNTCNYSSGEPFSLLDAENSAVTGTLSKYSLKHSSCCDCHNSNHVDKTKSSLTLYIK